MKQARTLAFCLLGVCEHLSSSNPTPPSSRSCPRSTCPPCLQQSPCRVSCTPRGPEGPPVCTVLGPCPFLTSTAISQIPRSPSFLRPPSQGRSEVGGCQVGIIAPGKEMAVPSSVQVRLKIVIFKETKLGHGDLGRPRAAEPTGAVPRCQAKGISEPLSSPDPTP